MRDAFEQNNPLGVCVLSYFESQKERADDSSDLATKAMTSLAKLKSAVNGLRLALGGPSNSV